MKLYGKVFWALLLLALNYFGLRWLFHLLVKGSDVSFMVCAFGLILLVTGDLLAVHWLLRSGLEEKLWAWLTGDDSKQSR